MRLRLGLTVCAASLTALAAAGDAAAQEAAFTPAADIGFTPASSPQSVATGDFDSDGRQDLAVPDFGGDAAAVRLGNGDGTFRAGGAFGTLSRPEDIAVGDFNADGTEDLAVAAQTGPGSNHDVAVLLGRGDGTFQQMATIDLPGRSNSLAVADFDGDGREDLAANTNSSVIVRLGAGNGTFAGGVDVPFTGSFPIYIAAGDFDGNGNADLAVAMSGIGTPSKVGVLPGRGNATFEPVKTAPLPNLGFDLAAGDFDADGRTDVAVSIPVEDRVSVRLGRGDGTLSDDSPDVAVGDRPTAVVVGDFDSDGREDLATSNADGDDVSVRLGDGNGGFGDGGSVAVGDLPVALALGDFDADGREDLATANGRAGTLSVRLGSGTPALAGSLLVNGGFEQGLGARLATQSPAIPGWTTTGGMTFVRYGVVPRLGFPSWIDSPRHGTGGTNFLWGGDSTGQGGVTTAVQTADVSGFAEAIDAGRATANLSAWLGGAQSYPDHMAATAEFLAGEGAVAGSLRIGPVTKEDRRNRTAMLRRAGSAPVPAGTRGIRVTLTSTDADTVSSATADNVKLTLDVRPPDPTGPGAGPSGGGEGGEQSPRPAEFGADPRVRVKLAQRRVRLRQPVAVRISNANGFTVTGTLSSPRPARRFTAQARGTATVKVVLPKSQRRKLARKGKLALRLAVVVQDPAGNRRTVRQPVVLRKR